MENDVHHPRRLILLRAVQESLRRAEDGFADSLAIAVVDFLGDGLLDDQVPFCCQENFRKGRGIDNAAEIGVIQMRILILFLLEVGDALAVHAFDLVKAAEAEQRFLKTHGFQSGLVDIRA
ncbi:hypothetical protein D3C75_649140 [compost metagenome]